MLKLLLLMALLDPLLNTNVKCQEQGDRIIKMYKIACEKPNFEYFSRNYSCALKAINRHKAVANMDGWLLKDLKNLTVHLQLFKYYTRFRPYFVDITMNYCKLMASGVVRNSYLKIFLRPLENTTNVLHECPLQGHLYASKLFMDAKDIKIPLPLGRFSLVVSLFEGYPLKALGEISYYADIYPYVKSRLENRGRKPPVESSSNISNQDKTKAINLSNNFRSIFEN